MTLSSWVLPPVFHSVFFCLLFTSSLAWSAGPEQASVHELTLKKEPEIPNGRIAFVGGKVGPAGIKLSVKNLDILQPIGITLFSETPKDNLTLELSKEMDRRIARQGSTGGLGLVTFKFRMAGDLQIRIVSPNGSKTYRLAVWAGDEIEPPMPSIFTSSR